VPSKPKAAPFGLIRTHRAGKLTLQARVLGTFTAEPEFTRKDVMLECAVGAGEAQRVLTILCERGHAERLGHGRYRLNGVDRT
jgi:hypothetical protein